MLNIFWPWNSAGGRCLKLVEPYLWRTERYSRGKQAWFWQLKPYFNSFRRMKNIWPTSVSQNRREVSCWRRRTACNSGRWREENQLRFSNSKYFRFYWTKKHFISEWYFPKTMSLGVLSWEKLKNRETHYRIVSLGVEEQLLIFSSLLPALVKRLQKFVNFCLKVDHSANLKHIKSTWSTTYRPEKGTKS